MRLELGVDVGSLDVALLAGYPGTIASTWQQAGRSGRRHDESLAILLAGNDPVDQYLMRHPDYFFAQSPEHAVVDPENPYVLANHLQAAAFELPLVRGRRRAVRPAGHADRRRASRCRHAHGGGRRVLLFRRAESGPAGEPAAHERQHVFDRAGARPGPAGQSRRAGPRGDRQRRCHQRPELVYPEAVYLHNGESLLRPRARSGGQGGLRRAARDGLLHAGRARYQRGDQGPAKATSVGRSFRAAAIGLWRRRRHLADRGLQEDQVRHAREHRPGPGRHSAAVAPDHGRVACARRRWSAAR